MAVKKIGFDFDKVFVNYPPIVPDFVVDFLYKGKTVFKKRGIKNGTSVHYRMPGIIEQKIRIFSHHPLFRQPIRENIKSVKKIKNSSSTNIYLVSSRFGFLRERTNNWLEKHRMSGLFDEVHFNFNNNQPHIFKEGVIKKLKITHYLDDDLDLLVYLSEKLPDKKFFWITKNPKNSYNKLPKNIIIIRDVKEFLNKHFKS